MPLRASKAPNWRQLQPGARSTARVATCDHLVALRRSWAFLKRNRHVLPSCEVVGMLPGPPGHLLNLPQSPPGVPVPEKSGSVNGPRSFLRVNTTIKRVCHALGTPKTVSRRPNGRKWRDVGHHGPRAGERRTCSLGAENRTSWTASTTQQGTTERRGP